MVAGEKGFARQRWFRSLAMSPHLQTFAASVHASSCLTALSNHHPSETGTAWPRIMRYEAQKVLTVACRGITGSGAACRRIWTLTPPTSTNVQKQHLCKPLYGSESHPPVVKAELLPPGPRSRD